MGKTRKERKEKKKKKKKKVEWGLGRKKST